jgi:hypothetical protein
MRWWREFLDLLDAEVVGRGTMRTHGREVVTRERTAGRGQTQYGTVRSARREVAAGDRRGIRSQRRHKGMR